MVIDPAAESLALVIQKDSVESVDWRGPFWLVTSGLVLRGAFGFSFVALSIDKGWSYAISFLAFFVWRYGAYKTGLFPFQGWTFFPRRRTSFSSVQVIVSSVAILLFLLVGFSVFDPRLSLDAFVGTLVISAAFGVHDGWYGSLGKSS